MKCHENSKSDQSQTVIPMNRLFFRSFILAGAVMLHTSGLNAADNPSAGTSGQSIPGKNIEISGLIEVEGSRISGGGEGVSADLILSTFELGLEVKMIENLSGHVTLLYEEDGDDELLVDEAYIRMKFSDSPFFVQAGRFTQLFGNFETGMIADPITLELAETKHHASIMAGFESDVFSASLTAFRSEVINDDEETVNTWVAALSVSGGKEDGFRYTLGGSAISNIAATDGLKDSYEPHSFSTSDHVWGYSIYGVAGSGPFALRAEYIAAAEEFTDGDFSGMRPSAWNIEAGYAFSEPLALSLRYGGADDFTVKQQLGATLSLQFLEHARVALEYLHEDSRDGEGADKDIVTLQLAMEF